MIALQCNWMSSCLYLGVLLDTQEGILEVLCVYTKNIDRGRVKNIQKTIHLHTDVT